MDNKNNFNNEQKFYSFKIFVIIFSVLMVISVIIIFLLRYVFGIINPAPLPKSKKKEKPPPPPAPIEVVPQPTIKLIDNGLRIGGKKVKNDYREMYYIKLAYPDSDLSEFRNVYQTYIIKRQSFSMTFWHKSIKTFEDNPKIVPIPYQNTSISHPPPYYGIMPDNGLPLPTNVFFITNNLGREEYYKYFDWEPKTYTDKIIIWDHFEPFNIDIKDESTFINKIKRKRYIGDYYNRELNYQPSSWLRCSLYIGDGRTEKLTNADLYNTDKPIDLSIENYISTPTTKPNIFVDFKKDDKNSIRVKTNINDIIPNKYSFYTIIYDISKNLIKTYVNGVLLSSDSIEKGDKYFSDESMADSYSDKIIGNKGQVMALRSNFYATFNDNYKLDNLYYFDKMLTENEIKILYKTSIPKENGSQVVEPMINLSDINYTKYSSNIESNEPLNKKNNLFPFIPDPLLDFL
jgi:hypothetical protein